MAKLLLSALFVIGTAATAGDFSPPSVRAVLKDARSAAKDLPELKASPVAQHPTFVIVAVDFASGADVETASDVSEIRVYKFKKVPGENSLRLREIALQLGVPYGELAKQVRAARKKSPNYQEPKEEPWHGSEHHQIWVEPGKKPPKTYFDDTLH